MDTNIVLSQPNVFETSFITQVFSNCDISEKTRKDYLYRIGRFRQFVQANGGLNRNTLLEFKRTSLAADSSISVTTKNKHLTVATLFLKQLFRLGILKVDLASGVRGFKISSGFNVRNFTTDEVARIIVSLNDSTDIRLKALVCLKLFQGLRDCELTRLMVEHVNLADGFIQVHGKARDGLENMILVPQVVHVLRNYLKATKQKSGFLFTSTSKRNRGSGLTTKSVWLIIRQFLDSLDIHRNPHQCRAFFCSQLVRQMGTNLFDVIQYSRHASIQTLQSYVARENKAKTIPQFKQAFGDYVMT